MGEDYPRTLIEIESRFGDESACREYLFGIRWPAGFVCPVCKGTEAWRLSKGLWQCHGCRRQVSVTARTIFDSSHLSLRLWFRAMWHMTSQKNGISALGLQRILGLGSYKTAWSILHKLRRAMVRLGRDRLSGRVEVDETLWGGEEPGMRGSRETEKKAWFIVAVEVKGLDMGRIRLKHIPNAGKAALHGFIRESIEEGSTVCTDGLQAYKNLAGYRHERYVQEHQKPGEYVLPHVHRVVSLLKRWLLGTHQGAIAHAHLDDYFNEFTFRFNRRLSASRGKLFYRLVQQAVQAPPHTFATLATPPYIGGGGVK
jgi:ribosomal protein L37AE/L43A/transposase-like protein